MSIKNVKLNDINLLEKMIQGFFEKNKHNKNLIEDKNKKLFSNYGLEVLENTVIGKYAYKKSEIVNQSDFNKAFSNLGYKLSN